MKSLILAAAVAGVIAVGWMSSASAYTCRTTCTNWGNQQTCRTTCY